MRHFKTRPSIVQTDIAGNGSTSAPPWHLWLVHILRTVNEAIVSFPKVYFNIFHRIRHIDTGVILTINDIFLLFNMTFVMGWYDLRHLVRGFRLYCHVPNLKYPGMINKELHRSNKVC